ncbi:MAG: DUF1540 domain-containing protein [Oscillospiraceae bacterium]
MNQLRCSVSSCANYADNYCCRPEIKVDGPNATDKCETKCQSFISKTCGATNCACNSTTNPCLCISCSAKECEYNESGKCVAASVSIDGQGAATMTDTQCSSFKRK